MQNVSCNKGEAEIYIPFCHKEYNEKEKLARERFHVHERPKAEEIAKDNEMRKEWNATLDQALVSGAAEEQIREIKRECISEEIKASIDRREKRPELFLLYLSRQFSS